jgi:hypothetical protein
MDEHVPFKVGHNEGRVTPVDRPQLPQQHRRLDADVHIHDLPQARLLSGSHKEHEAAHQSLILSACPTSWGRSMIGVKAWDLWLV